jgi:hypothetical protein
MPKTSWRIGSVYSAICCQIVLLDSCLMCSSHRVDISKRTKSSGGTTKRLSSLPNTFLVSIS